MKTPLLQRWAKFVLAHSRCRVWPYFCLALTATLVALQFTKYARGHFLLVMLVVTLMAFERLAFAELFAANQAQIDKTEQKK